MQDSVKRFSRWAKTIGSNFKWGKKKMKPFQNLVQNNGMMKNIMAESPRQAARWMDVDAYAHQSWAKRLPGVLLATLILTALLLWMGLPVWFLH